VRSAANATVLPEAQRAWRTAALAMLSVRVIQGFHLPDAHTWMANKFQTTMPGALFGTDYLISFMLHHFWRLYAGVILLSAAELVVGAMLMAGALTRVAASSATWLLSCLASCWSATLGPTATIAARW